MESYENLLKRYEKIKEAYSKNQSTDMQDKILHTLDTYLCELKEAIIQNDNRKAFELTVKIKMFLDGFKLFSTKKSEKQTKTQD